MEKKIERLIIEGFTAKEAEIGRYLWMMADVRGRLKHLLSGIDEAWLDWQPPYKSNTVGTLLYHIALVEIDWLYCEVQETEFPPQVMAMLPFAVRDETGGLTAVSRIPISNHIQRLDDCRAYLLDVFNSMSLVEFRRVRHLPNYEVTPEWVLYHLIQHEAEHLGQVMEIVQQLQAGNIG